jgi:cytochrome c biogenesis protein CcmG, thiol:disulfide interchange protein DsbE
MKNILFLRKMRSKYFNLNPLFSKMTKFLSLTVALLTLFATVTFAQKQIPAAILKTLDGKTVNMSDYMGKGTPTIVSFWATWCAPCKRELDGYSKVYETWQKKYGVTLIAVSVDKKEAIAKVKPMVEQKGWKYTVLTDNDGTLQNALKLQSVPQTYILDKKGKIIHSQTGYAPGDEVAMEKIIKAIK